MILVKPSTVLFSKHGAVESLNNPPLGGAVARQAAELELDAYSKRAIGSDTCISIKC